MSSLTDRFLGHERFELKLSFILVVLTLLSCCFLGSTFARYTSGGTGTATVQVAKWDVKNTQESMDVSFLSTVAA